MAALIQHRRGTAAQWAAANPVLNDGEIGYDTTSKVIKIGDGTTTWNALSSYLLADVQAALSDHSNTVDSKLSDQSQSVNSSLFTELATVPSRVAAALALDSTVSTAAAQAATTAQAGLSLIKSVSTRGKSTFVGTTDGSVKLPTNSIGNVTTDLEVAAHIKPDTWTPPVGAGLPAYAIIGKYRASSNAKGWSLTISNSSGLSGHIRLSWTIDGVNDTNANSTVVNPFTNGQAGRVRATLDVDNGASGWTVRFFTSTDGPEVPWESVTWTQLGADVTGAGVTSIWPTTTSPLAIGAVATTVSPTVSPFKGDIYSAIVRNGIGGTVIASPNFDGAYAPDAQGNTWSANGTATITPRTQAALDTILGLTYSPLTVADATALETRVKAYSDAGGAQDLKSLSAKGQSAFLGDGGWVRTAHKSALQVSGDLDVRVHAAAANWAPTSANTLIGKWRANTGAKSWNLTLTSTGLLRLTWSVDGVNDTTATATAAISALANAEIWVRATLDVDNGSSGWTVKLYTSLDGVTWTQLGADITGSGVTSIASSSESMAIGAVATTTTAVNFLNGKVFKAEVRNGINGTLVASPDFNGSYNPDAQGNVWEATAPASITPKTRVINDPVIGTYTPALSQEIVDLDNKTKTATPLTVTKSGNVLTITGTVDNKPLIQTADISGGNNGVFNITGATYDGVVVSANDDDITPIRTQLGTLGANHGFSVVQGFTNPDAKTNADIGSVWTDGTREYVLLGIQQGLLAFGGSYVNTSGLITSAVVAPTANLTHVSGATKTGAVNYTTLSSSLTQFLNIFGRKVTTIWLDDKQLLVDGTYYGRVLSVHETYEIWDYADMYDKAKANIGVVLTQLDIAGAQRISNTYKYLPNGTMHISTELLELKPTDLGRCGFIQAGIPTGSVTRYVPGVGTTEGGHNWTTGVAMASYATSVLVNPPELLVASDVPAFSLDTTSTYGFAMGYLPYGIRDNESSANSVRKTHTEAVSSNAGVYWDLRSTKKNYPNAITARTAGWGRITAESFRTFLSPAQNALVLASKGSARNAWASLNAVKNIITP